MIYRGLNIDKKEAILHTLFWITWIFSFTIIQSIGSGLDEWLLWLIYYIVTLPVFIIHTYLIAYWLVPRAFFRGKYLMLMSGMFLLLIFFSILELVISNEIVFRNFGYDKVFEPGYINISNILISGIGNHYIILVFLAIKAGRTWYKAENRKTQLLLTKRETDIEIYRYQLQPELIYTLIEELDAIASENPDKAPEMIVKISKFLNHYLNEGKEEMLSLQIEVKLLEIFLAIHKEALGERLNSNFIVNGMLKSHVVPPLLLLPFINSAIKLMYECNISFESTVIIKAEKKYLLFSFTFWSDNDFRLSDDQNIEITKKRLNYNYPGKYRLIESMDDNFREVSIEVFY